MCAYTPVVFELLILTFPFRPYYIWLGRSRSCDVSRFLHAFEVESGNTIGNLSPRNALGSPASASASSSSTTVIRPSTSLIIAKSSTSDGSPEIPELEIGEAALPLNGEKGNEPNNLTDAPLVTGSVIIDVSPPLSSFHYQVKNASTLIFI